MAYAEIVRGSYFGEFLYEISKRSDVNTIVEIGTWSGMGTTKCILDGLVDANKFDAEFLTFECIKDRHTEAVANLSEYSKKFNNLKIINGTVISSDEFPMYDSSCMVKDWYDTDLAYSKICGCKFSDIPETVDLLIIDGGEYTGRLEFQKLKSRCKIIALDDTTQYKTKPIRDFLLNNPEYKLLADNQTERNGCSIFERIEGIS